MKIFVTPESIYVYWVLICFVVNCFKKKKLFFYSFFYILGFLKKKKERETNWVMHELRKRKKNFFFRLDLDKN